MLKKICKVLIAIPPYIFLLIEGFFGGYSVGKYDDPWDKIKKWILK